jgi:hypothetical protein
MKETSLNRQISVLALALVAVTMFACSDDSTSGRPGAGGTGSTGSTTGGAGATGSSAMTSGGGNPATSAATTVGSGTTGSGGGTATAGGAGGSTGGGAGSGIDAGSGGSTADAGRVDSGSSDAGFPPITECAKPSVDRLEQWEASGEGTTVPATGNTLVKEGDHYVSKIQFVNMQWHVVPVYLGNTFNAQADLSKSSGFLLTYSSTSDMYAQLRPASHWDGGDQYATPIPSTGGVTKSQFFSFAPDKWKSVFGPPAYGFDVALKEARAFVFVGQFPNTVVFSGLRVDGYVPPCL